MLRIVIIPSDVQVLHCYQAEKAESGNGELTAAEYRAYKDAEWTWDKWQRKLEEIYDASRNPSKAESQEVPERKGSC